MTKLALLFLTAGLAFGQYNPPIGGGGGPVQGSSGTFTGNVTIGTTLPVTGANLSLGNRLGFPVSTSGRGPFVFDMSLANIFTGVVDPTLYIGYNQTATGSLIQSGEPALSLGFEANYNDGSGSNKMEVYLQYVASDGVTSVRPMFWQIDRTSNTVFGASIVGPIAFRDSTTPGVNTLNIDTTNKLVVLQNGAIIKSATNNVAVLQQVNAAGSNTLDLIKLDGSNILVIDPGATGAKTGGNLTVAGTLAVTGTTATLGGVNFLLKNGGLNYVYSGTTAFRISRADGLLDILTLDNATGALNVDGTAPKYQLGGTTFASQNGTANYFWSGSASIKISNAAGNADLFVLNNTGTALQLPGIHSTTGTRYLCVDSTGNVTASATACVGT